MICYWCRACEELWHAVSPFVSAQDNTNALRDADPNPERLAEAAALRDSRPTEAFRQFVEMAADGSVWSMLNVAIAYERGDWVPCNESRAEYWYRRAWKGGSDAAMLRLAELMLRSGRLDEAETILAPAVAASVPVALRLLADIRLHAPRTPPGVVQGGALLERAVALGDFGAGLKLARLMARGRFGLRHIPAGIRRFAELVDRLEAAKNVADIQKVDRPMKSNRSKMPRQLHASLGT